MDGCAIYLNCVVAIFNTRPLVSHTLARARTRKNSSQPLSYATSYAIGQNELFRVNACVHIKVVTNCS